MAEHRVRKNNIIYIIPTDELFIKWKNDEAFIDEYGRLMNRKPHRVLKELKHYVADSVVQKSYASPIKDLVRDKMVEYSKYAIDRAEDVFFYEVIPNVWHKHIVPLWKGAKDVLFSKELKIDQIKCETEHKVVENQPILSEIMTKEEVDAEKRKLLYHWIGLLSSLTKLQNAGELDVESTLAQLTGTEGSKKQFIILVEKGREGWNCRSLLGIALFRSPKSKVFVLQATMRCLRQLTKEQLKATIFLSKENYDTLDDELRKNYNMEISDFGKSPNTNKKVYKVRVLPPPRSIKMKRLWHEYSLIEKEYSVPIDFHLAELDESKYEAKMYEKGSLRLGLSEKETNIDSMKEQERFSEFSLTAEISRYMNISCLTIAKILRESVDGSDNIVAAVNRHNEILEDVIIPEIFHTLYEVKSTQKSEDVDMVLLREPKDSGYYEFSANDELVITKGHNNFTPKEEAKSFHADTYCFDSKPEKECFLQYISSNKVKEIYFTGMFTSNQGDLSVQYYDPESKRLRKYYPDFLALMEDGSYQLIEVKGDNKIDDEVVLAKKAAAEEMAVASGIHYLMYAGSTLMKSNVLEPTLVVQQASIDI